MSNFTVNFTIPWLLFLLIPAVFFALFPYFRLSKRYRRTRNRIISIVLHLAIMVMCVSVLSGMTFAYDVESDANEVIILVDCSYSNRESEAIKEQYVESLINESAGEFHVGLVAFGYNQVEISGLTSDTESLSRSFASFCAQGYSVRGVEVDTSATDIAAALNYAKGMLTRETLQTAKIIILTDGIETDGNAMPAIRSLAAEGIRIDVASFANSFKLDAQISDVIVPTDNIVVGTPVVLSVSVDSVIGDEKATVTLTDKDEKGQNKETGVTFDIVRGSRNIELEHTFESSGLHELKFELEFENEGDAITFNNIYYSYIYINEYKDILLLERYEPKDEDYLYDLLVEENYNVTRLNVTKSEDVAKIPKDVNELRSKYQQVILCNISNEDLTKTATPNAQEGEAFMPDDFDKTLHDYVYTYGGSVFVVGGYEQDENGNAVMEEVGSEDNKKMSIKPHAFNVVDMESATYYADMLPVQVKNYTPPVGIMIVIDRSGSMGDEKVQNTALYRAKKGAKDCVDRLFSRYRDYIGVMTLESNYGLSASIMPAYNSERLEAAINEITVGGGTIYNGAIEAAGNALLAKRDLYKRMHIIIVSDGAPQDDMNIAKNGNPAYGPTIDKYAAEGITFGMVYVETNDGNIDTMNKIKDRADKITKEKYGIESSVFPATGNDVASAMINALNETLEVGGTEAITFNPKINNKRSQIIDAEILKEENSLPELDGFYGTQERRDADVILTASFGIPLYAQHKYGAGKVGAFMSSLGNDDWSTNFMRTEGSTAGRRIVRNIVGSLMPTKDISPQDITVTLNESNYSNRINVFVSSELGDDEQLKVTVKTPPTEQYPEGNYIAVPMDSSDNYRRASFVAKEAGVYTITVEKVDANGQTIGKKCVMYKAFSYSKEYSTADGNGANLLADMASEGRGSVLSSPSEAYANINRAIHKEYDPMLLFIILSIVFFLLDVAVRKFKFKWPHEIIRDYKEKKNMANK